MSITSKKITAYSKTHQMLPPVPSPAFSAADLQLWYDTAAEEARVAINGIVDALGATTTGDSGAENIGIEPIAGVNAANVQNALEQLKLLLNSATTGAIPDGSLGPAKLSFDPATQAELDAHNADTVKHVPYALATGTANTYVATLTPAPTSYTRGMAVSVEINVLNTGASTININGLGAKSIKKSNGNDVLAGQLKVGIIYTLRYNGTNFILQGEGGEYGTAGAAQVLTGYTVGTEAGIIPGTFQGKRYASGTVLSSSTTSLFTYLSNAQQNMKYITVTGLPFKPTKILVYRKDDPVETQTIYTYNPNAIYPEIVKVLTCNTASTINSLNVFKADASPASVTSTSFLLPVDTASNNVPFEWEIIE